MRETLFSLTVIALSLAGLFGLDTDGRVTQAADYRWPLRDPLAYDGDTLYVTMPALPPELREIAVRVRGVDAPEMRGNCLAEKRQATRARNFVRGLLASAEPAFRDPEWGQYGGRVVATVIVHGKDLAAMLVERGLGRPYDGGQRKGWCG